MQSQLSQTLAQVQTMETTLAQLSAQVNGAGSGSATSSATSTYKFTEFLGVGSQNAQVAELQQYFWQKDSIPAQLPAILGRLPKRQS